MQFAHAPSWRLSAGDGQASEQLLLFVRDAAGLRVPPDPLVPPPLLGDVPHTTEMTPDQQRAAGSQWSAWWRDALDLEIARHRHDGRDDALNRHERARQKISDLEALCDPPHFTALADRPELQAAARASIEEFRRWTSRARRQPNGDRPSSPLDWALIKQVAEDVAFDHAVSPDRVRASITVLPVHGTWWRRIAPGLVICSTAAAAEHTTAQPLLHDAFDSHVRGAA